MLSELINKSVISQFSGDPMQVLSKILYVVVIGFLLFQIGSVIYKFAVPAEEPVVTETPKTKAKTATPANPERQIASKHLFGQSAATKSTQRTVVDTKLDLSLRGIFARQDKDTGLAIIHDNRSKKEQYFVVNDKIFGLATLEEIHKDHVIVLHNGRYETLRLPKKSLPGVHYSDSAEIKAEKKRVATDYRNRFLSRDGMDLIKLFGFQTYSRGGITLGFKVHALGDEGREMMEVLGVKDNDLITVLNGKRFAESIDAFEEIKQLKTATSIDVIIERDGQELPFHFELDAPIDPTAGYPEGTTEQDIIRQKALAKPEWNDTEEYKEFKRKQLERSTGKRLEVEYDH